MGVTWEDRIHLNHIRGIGLPIYGLSQRNVLWDGLPIPKVLPSLMLWFIPVIPATQEVETGRLVV
jgi:hypothetical protein